MHDVRISNYGCTLEFCNSVAITGGAFQLFSCISQLQFRSRQNSFGVLFLVHTGAYE